MYTNLKTNNYPVENIILKYSSRGMNLLTKYIPNGYCMQAAYKLLSLDRKVIFIYTGFYVDGYSETDGPIGAYFLGITLKKLGFTPIIICDNYCKMLFTFENVLECLFYPLNGYPYCEIQRILKHYNPIAHISIERCGKNIYQKYQNIAQKDISAYTAPVDEMYVLGSRQAPSIAIGDGGNEIGMGNLYNIIKTKLNIEPSIIKSDILILATTSNWGAYGILSYLSQIENYNFLPSFEEVSQYLSYIVELGCVDGIQRLNQKSVDGLSWELEKEILESLTSCWQTAIN